MTTVTWHSYLPVFMDRVHEAVSSRAEEEITIHIAEKTYLDPAAIAFIAVVGRELQMAGRRLGFTGDKAVMNYLSRLDLFSTLDLHYEEGFRRYPGLGRFVPVAAVTDTSSVQVIVRQVCEMALRYVPDSREFVPAMEWVVNELVDNITTHAFSMSGGMVCAQYFPNGRRITVGIADRGLGIKDSLAESHSTGSDFEAIKLATKRGITRSKDVGQGNGLAGSVQIVGLNSGELHIFSGVGGFGLTPDGERSFGTLARRMDGTLIRLVLNTGKPVNLMNTFMAESALGWSFLDYEAQRLSEAGGVVIAEECLHTRGRDTAKPLRNKLLNLSQNFEAPMLLDFAGVSPSSSFLDELLGRLVAQIGLAEFRRRFVVGGMDTTIRALANSVVTQRLESDRPGDLPP
jgi:anti-sigma regulatory factor (Ser/Thr protein kinase)